MKTKITLSNFLLANLFVILLCQFAWAGDRRTDKSVLKIMTFNTEFLWDGVLPEEGRAEFPWKGDETKALEHMQKIADVIKKEKPDVINLVEVENGDAVKVFNNSFLNGLGYQPYFIQGKDYYTGEDVALLTKIDPLNNLIQRWDEPGESGKTSKTVTKNYYVKFETSKFKIALIGLHFIAIPSDPSRKLQREAQADAMRDLAVELKKQGYEIVILGDFNDYDGEYAYRDFNNDIPITDVLKIAREMDKSNTSDDLVNVSAFITPKGRYTAHWDKNNNGKGDFPGEFTSIDHILLSSGLASKITSAKIPNFYADKNRSKSVDAYLLWCDHFPVWVRLKF